MRSTFMACFNVISHASLGYFYYLRQGGYVFARVCLFVCLCVSKITQKIIDGFFWNFQGMSKMAKTTSVLILVVIRNE